MTRATLWLLLATAVAPLVWGSTYIVTTEMLPEGRPLLSGVLRSLPFGLLLIAASRTLPAGSWWWKATVLGALNIGGFFALLFISAYRLPGGVAATFGAAAPLMVAVLAWALLSERLTPWRLGWGVAGVVGVALVVLGPEAALDPVGVAAGIAAPASMALGTVLTKRWGRPVGLVAFTGWLLTAGGLVLAPLALLVEGPPPALDLPAVMGYLWIGGVGTAVAYILWFRGIGALPVGQTSFLQLLSPVSAAMLGWALLGQTLTLQQGAGFVLALVAIVAAQLRPHRYGPRRARSAGPTAASAAPTAAPVAAPTPTPCGARA